MNVWGDTWGMVSTWGASWGGAAPDVAVMDGGIRRRRHTPAKARDRLSEDIRREQLEDERYLAELEKKARPQVASESPRTAVAVEPAAVPLLPDAIARAASAEQVIARARTSSAEALARAKADERRRTALLLLMLD